MNRTVTVTVAGEKLTVDVEAWAAEYGVEPTAKAVRDDVRTYVAGAVRDALGWAIVGGSQ